MRKQQTNEQQQATPNWIPIICLIGFCVIAVPVRDAIKPVGLALFDLDFLVNFESVLVFTVVPIIILVIAELLFRPFWRSMLFSVGSVLMIIEWLITIRQLHPVPLIMFLTSLPFLIFVAYWNARSLNSMLRLDKRWTPLP